MVQIKEIEPISNFISQNILEIYNNAFPPCERRNSDHLNHFWQTHPALSYNLIERENREIGFLLHWDFNSFLFIEHFAVAANERGNGMGRLAFSQWIAAHTAPTVLEVEPATDDLSTRRIRFYESFGFTFFPQPYLQPPYHAGGEPVALRLMYRGEPSMVDHFEEIKAILYKEVYDVDQIR